MLTNDYDDEHAMIWNLHGPVGELFNPIMPWHQAGVEQGKLFRITVQLHTYRELFLVFWPERRYLLIVNTKVITELEFITANLLTI